MSLSMRSLFRLRHAPDRAEVNLHESNFIMAIPTLINKLSFPQFPQLMRLAYISCTTAASLVESLRALQE